MQSPRLLTHAESSFRTKVAVLFVAALSLTGCGGSSSTVSVQGHVTYRGEPLENGLATFFPPEGRPISVAISEDGSYQAQLEPGEYVVAVSVGPGNERPAGYKLGDPVPPPKIVLPIQYSSRAKSTLSASVKTGQTEPINFDLK